MFLKQNRIKIKLGLNHVHSPDYLSATVLPKTTRQEKINSLHDVLPKRVWEDLHGHYYNAEENGQYEYFKYFTRELDKVRNEDLNILFPKLL